jgi:hypothetical protein
VIAKKLRPVERSVKGRPKKIVLLDRFKQQIELNYSRYQRVRFTGTPLDFALFSTAFPPLTRSKSAGESADFPRLFRIFCTRRWAILFPQRLRSDFAGISELGR